MDGDGNEICVQDGGNVEGKYEIVNYCEPPLSGRYVHVKLRGRRRFGLCEIEIYGVEDEKTGKKVFVILDLNRNLILCKSLIFCL